MTTPSTPYTAALYTDNGGYFVLPLLKGTYKQHGVAYYTAPITKPSAVGLIERNVQLIMSSLRNCCTAAGTTYGWTRYLTAAVNAVNTRLVRVHGYSPAELLLGYNPRLLHVSQFAPNARKEWLAAQVPLKPQVYAIHTWTVDEKRERATELRTMEQARWVHQKAFSRLPPEPGNMVLIRDHQRDKTHGRKLDTRWLGPRLLVGLTPNGVSGYVREVYGSGEVKRYHLDDLRKWITREVGNHTAYQTANYAILTSRPTAQYAQDAMQLAGYPGQRAFFLSQY